MVFENRMISSGRTPAVRGQSTNVLRASTSPSRVMMETRLMVCSWLQLLDKEAVHVVMGIAMRRSRTSCVD
jgi:hypothetical protein